MTSESDSTSNGWIPWWLWWGGIGLFSLFLLLIGTYYGLTWKWKADFEEEIQKLKQDGHPHSPDALQKAYEERTPNVKDDLNWKLPDSLRTIVDKKILSADGIDILQDDWLKEPPEKRRNRSRKLLDLFNQHESTLQNQLEKKIYPTKLDFSKGFTEISSSSVDLLNEGRIFSLYTRALIGTGQLKKATSIIHKLYRRGRVIRQEPLLMSLLLSNAFTSYANSNMELLLQKNEIPQEALEAFQVAASKKIKQDALFVLEGDLVLGAEKCRTVIENGTANNMSLFFDFWSPDKHGVGYEWLPSGLFWLPASNFVRVYRKHLKLFQKPYYEIKPRLKRNKTHSSSDGYFDRFYQLFSQLIITSQSSIYENLNDQRSRVELLHLAVRAKLHSQRDRSTLTPIPNIDESTDPYSGKPYKVKETNTHVILYSVGKNLKDDGGSIEEQNRNDPKDVGVKIKK
jgi:hypothetical protein